MSHKKLKFAVGSAIIVFAIGYLITTSINSTSKFFVTVDELALAMNQYQGAGLKVKGKVVNGSITRDPNNYLDVSFKIEEKTSVLPVVYKGVTPDMFEDGREVVVEGTIGRDGVFHANILLTSCPSKYEAEKEAGKMHPGDIPRNGKSKPGYKSLDNLPEPTTKTTI